MILFQCQAKFFTLILFYLLIVIIRVKSYSLIDHTVKFAKVFRSQKGSVLQCNSVAKSNYAINNKCTLLYSDYSFTPACVQCLLCLTIAREFQKKFKMFHQKTCCDCDEEPYLDKLNDTLNYFCANEFKSYDYREQKDDRVLDKVAQHSKHVPCNYIWSKMLQKMCLNFLNTSSGKDLYLRWVKESKEPNFDINTFFCRSFGLFQFCRNIPLSLQADTQLSFLKSKFFSFRK